MGLQLCRHTCGRLNFVDVWPMPTGTVTTGGTVQHRQINSNALYFRTLYRQETTNDFWEVNQNLFLSQVAAKIPRSTTLVGNSNAASLHIDITINNDDIKLLVKINETYRLSVNQISNDIVVSIEANNIFGARNALETLAQVIIYDDVQQKLLVS